MYVWIVIVHVSLEKDARLIQSSLEWNLKANSFIYSSRMVWNIYIACHHRPLLFSSIWDHIREVGCISFNLFIFKNIIDFESFQWLYFLLLTAGHIFYIFIHYFGNWRVVFSYAVYIRSGFILFCYGISTLPFFHPLNLESLEDYPEIYIGLIK